ncbi:kinase [Roseospira marina]|uniref:Kinase n=1 Tax=Roseospira marina TaxID=140057 RepID=A0A5M6IC78_9PROT|nr:lipopolysaccharide kinase InaA family protein [Roseospira marina]KAA5605851.1 kinase [Roseospira marina]MBB4313670.1 serine/threonine protein kinase [Roseospira marina]MBB5086832.1 serine/threonine protein kinase [Roseospira marina]
MTIITLTTQDGQPVQYKDEIIGQGGMKDVYFSPDRSYVVAFFRDPLDYQGKERLKSIVGSYREGILEREGGEYWKDLFCWPTAVVERDGRIGVVVPVYKPHFFFAHGSVNNDMLGIKGKEKEGKWFASASNRAKFLAPEEKGTWLSHLQICLMISRAVRRLHAAGLAHSDLSYKNVLVDPSSGRACVIDIDGLVVPGKFPPDVVGTPDFIAPEVIATQHLERTDENRKLPSTLTDRHALAVLIYMYLFYRHPLRGGKVHDMDATKDEELAMGTKALFVEHPTDAGNRVNADQLTKAQLPWGDPSRMPYTIAGPLLADLFERAFVTGLHAPHERPTPSEWENALVRTIDMIQPCANGCEMGWYVFDNTTKPKCPYCGTPYRGQLPVLNLYSSRHSGTYMPDNHRVMVWNGQSLFPWHVSRAVFPNEHLSAAQKKRVGYFQLHNGDWYLVNEGMPHMHDVSAKKDVPIGGHVKLTDGSQFLLSREEGGRLVQVQLVNG